MSTNGKIITDVMGQWKHPGKPTRIPGNDITMMGVNYPVYAKPNKGKGTMMYPGENYNFPKASFVDEYPLNVGIPSLDKEQQGLYAFPHLDISDNLPHFGATVGYKTPKINVSGNYMYGKPTLTAAFNFGSGGQMIRRADGSYSQRGLWDNIRANKGSGKKPTKEMLEQERKIKAKKMKNGGTNNPGFEALPEYVQAKILANMGYGGYYNPYMEEGGEPNGEMALGQMSAVSDKMAKLLQFVKPEDNLDPWIASKLAVMDDSADAISDYLTYSERGENEEEEEGSEMNEQEMEEMKMGGIPQRYKNMGFTKVGVKKNSTRPGKKWMVLAKKGDKYKVVHGGYDGMKDFSQHHDKQRKENFWNRMGGKNSSKATDPFSPLYWHKRFGTWEEGGEIYEMQTGGSVVDYMSQRGMAYDKASRKKLAQDLGIENYDFSAEKNLELLSLLRDGEVKDPIKKRVSSNQQSYNKNIPPMMMTPFKASSYYSTYPIMSYPSSERRNLESGTIVDKGTNTMYIIQNNKVVKKAPVLTGQAGKNKSKDPNKNIKGVASLENNPQDRSTPTGTYFMQEPGKAGIYGWPGFGLQPIPAFGQAAPEAKATAIHITYGSKPKPGSGMKGHPDPAEFRRRNAAYEGPASGRYMSYGCTNAQGETIDCLKSMFPKGDTAIYIDSRNLADKQYINSVKQRREEGGSTFSGNAFYKMGGKPCYECGGMYAQGGIYINPKNEGKFTEAAGRAGMGVQEFANYVLSNKEDFSSTTIKRANFAHNAAQWKKAYGGIHLDPAKKGTFKAQATRMGMGVQEAATAILNAPEGKYSPEMRRKANFARNFAKQMGGLVEGAEVEVTPEQAELLRKQGYDFEII